MTYSIPDTFNSNRYPREAFGLKADSTLHRITMNPSSDKKTLYKYKVTVSPVENFLKFKKLKS